MRPCRLVALLSLLIVAGCASAPPPPVKAATAAAVKPLPAAPLKAAKPAAAPQPEPARPPAVAASPAVAPAGAPQVALLLPLSGSSATLGNAMLNAAQLALFELADAELTLLPFDSKGTAEGAAAAISQALAQHVDIVVGPLFAAEARAAAPIAASARIPMLSLSADRSVAGNGTYVLGFLPGPQAVAVADYAAAKGRLHQAVLAPNNDYGRTVVADLKDAAGPLGISLGPIEFYDPAGLDLAPVFKRLLPDHPEPGFDALFLPDDGARLRRAAEQWAAQGIDIGKVVLLGTMLWDEAKPNDQPALSGAWYAAAPAAGFADFARRYAAAFGAPPPRLASLAYDATALAVVLGRQGNHDFSVGMICNPQGFAGVDGLFRLRPDGAIERAYAIKQVMPAGPAREIQPAAASFAAAER